MTILALLALPALKAYFWIQNGETWKAVLLGLGTASLAVLAGWASWRIKKALSGGKYRDPLLIEEKVSRLAYEAQLEVTAVLPEHGTEGRAKELLRNAAAAYDNMAGTRFKATRVRPAIPATEPWPPRRGMFQARNVLGVRELASLWHPLGGGDDLPMVRRSGARALLPSARGVSGGAYVEDTVSGRPQKIRFTDDALRRHHFYVAKTRMGKSTLMHHVVTHKMREKAAGRDDDAIVVVDPHADLVHSLLKHVPEEIADRVRLIDLADEERTPGINLLDAKVFTDRDRTADSVVRVSKNLWEQWGPRMQSILEHTVKSLHEYNVHPDTREDEQCTILDGLLLLADPGFRKRVLRRVADPYVVGWWARDFLNWTRTIRTEAISPVQTRLAYYASSKKARAIMGQPRSTLDIRETILNGGVLLVSTAQGTAGPEVSALVGASLLNLVDAVIREQGRLAPEERRGALVVVDEMQSMPGVDYESMLSELGQVRGVPGPGHPEPGQAGRPLPHHARHHPGQRRLPGGVPGVGRRRQAARRGAGPGAGGRGGPGVPAGAPVLRAGHGGRGAAAHLLHAGEEARGGRPGIGGARQGRNGGLHHLGGHHRLPGGRGGAAGQGVPGEAGAGRRG